MSGSIVTPGAQKEELEGFHLRLPIGFQAPAQWSGRQCILVPAAPDLVALDYAAVMASREQLQGLFGAGDAWPPADLTQADDGLDLAWHEREFVQGQSFAYSLLSNDRQRCLGCLYLYPTASPAHDAEAYLWAAATEPEPVRAAVMQEVMQWLENDWPFTALAWPGRMIAFSDWPHANYYAVRRNADC
ncbi:hypothetical protein [uncultured Halopseudomonas sp.]|uniref:hypothetical protein n=1 Tax=uncultured Halopseudomonas sp. TaxID=2901193 RepID=UPI0030EB9483|tara:strand:- start:18917 stop:19480 length:564 start_codon:yes stop_codon:yes gene_type:complete